jgi:hypothetical protein
MWMPFEQLPDASRIWIFQSDRLIEDQLLAETILVKTRTFIDQWTSHGKPLHAGAVLLHRLFLILAVDESVNPASGCSIDQAFRFIRDLGNQHGLSWLDRSKVVVQTAGRLHLLNLAELKSALHRGELSEARIFNNLISQKGELTSRWLIPLQQSPLVNL